jgi:uncharacterized protein YjbK
MNVALEKAILKQIGISKKEFKANVSDYQNADGGIPGFTYYLDTHEFSMKNQSKIVELLEETAEQLGEDVVQMVSNFGIFKRDGMVKQDKKDLYNFLGGNKKTEQGTVTNVLAWFAVETLAFEYDN